MNNPILRKLMQILSGVLVLVAVGCLGQGLIAVIGNVRSDPQTLTCAQLAQSGPGDNGHVTITQFHARTDQIVVSGGDGKTHWRKAFIPLVPASDPQASDFHVLLDSHEINTPAELSGLNTAPVVSGVINRAAQGPDSKAEDLLSASYPGVNVHQCWVVHHNMRVVTRAQGIGLLIASVVAIGLAWFVIKRIPPAPQNVADAGPVSAKFQP